MRLPRVALLVVMAAAVPAVMWLRRPVAPRPVDLEPRAGAAATRVVAVGPEAGRAAADERRRTLERFGYAQAWAEEAQSQPFRAFREWTERLVRVPAADRSAWVAEGVDLARGRRAAMSALIISDPQRALALTVPARVRRELPGAVLAELETRVSGRGEFALVATSRGSANDATGPVIRRRAVLGGQTYTAHVYGRREPQTAQAGGSLHGIVLDRELALHESPLRVLEPDEVPVGDARETCPVSDLPVAPQAAGVGVNTAALTVAEVAGRVVEFCATGADMLETYARQLEAVEDGAGARRVGIPPTAAEAPTAWTIGTKQVLVIRVDFSDVPGEPIARQTAQNVMDAGARSYLEDMSFGQTTLVTTVSENVYRMPQTGSAYALADNEGQLHTDARAAAGAQYTVASYDRIIVVFANLGTSRFPGSLLTFGGEGQINGANIWINGSASFNNATVTHELGHSYGLLHSNLWRINDGNPLSTAGNTLEYGDPFDMMGSSTRDARHHFNAWHKNRLGWLPDAAVTTVTASGTYRIHRFDSRNTSRAQPLALRIFRDGVRWYWVGLRQNFSTGTPQANGAYVVWGFNNRQQSQLLDLTTPGLAATDAALPLGTAFTDSTHGITIKPVARGGTDPDQFLEVEVTIDPAPANVVASWGREGALFFSGNTGLPVSPVPETNVPLGLAGVRAIAGGDQHGIALRADGSVVAWGDHVNGQTTVPTGITDAVAVAAGGDVSGVVRSDGTVRLWGLTTTGQTTPPAGLNNVSRLAIGRNHALVLKNDGSVVAWGTNNQGQANVPAGLADVVAITAGMEFSVALKRDGTVVSWGSANGRPPVGTTGIAAISASGALTGGQFVTALKTDGTVMAWGVNNAGQTAVPAGLTGVVAVATGGFHTLALKTDGTVVAWGGSGTGTVIPRSMPRARAIAASSVASFALIGPSISFLTQPQDQTIAVGESATLRVSASGVGAVGYQWRKDGVAIAGATTGTFALTDAGAGATGDYDVVVRDVMSTTTSSIARLTVGAIVAPAQQVSRIANLSIRTRAGTGAQTLIVGFVVGGGGTTGTKPLLVRGVGPTLGVFGVGGALTDPRIELYGAGAIKLLENDNWNASDAATFASVGAFALSAGSRDAALYNGALASAGYSAQLSGVGGATGVVLAEIYDVTPGATFSASTPRLVNVSARTVSGTGAEVLIAGFVIAGPNSKTVLLRAIGPTLEVFGVSGFLVDPRLELFDGAAVKVQENDNWGGAAALSAAFASVGAFQLTGASRDAALLATLVPGSYTAQVSGVGGGTGVALVEIYEVP